MILKEKKEKINVFYVKLDFIVKVELIRKDVKKELILDLVGENVRVVKLDFIVLMKLLVEEYQKVICI